MGYFRADALMIGQMVEKDCLRFSADNVASLKTLFRLPGKAGHDHFIVATLFGEQAESISRLTLDDAWFEVKGQLRDRSPEFESHSLSNIAIRVNAVNQLPHASSTMIHCELIGRLTHDPEHVVKGDAFEFSRFAIAINRLEDKKPAFFNISVFKPRLIKEVNERLKKGQAVFLSGDLTLFDKGGDSAVHGAIKLDRYLMIERQ